MTDTQRSIQEMSFELWPKTRQASLTYVKNDTLVDWIGQSGKVPQTILDITEFESSEALWHAFDAFEKEKEAAQTDAARQALADHPFQQKGQRLSEVMNTDPQAFIDRLMDDITSDILRIDLNRANRIHKILSNRDMKQMVIERMRMTQPMEQRENIDDLDEEIKKQLALETNKGSA